MQRGDAHSAEALYDRLRPRVESTVRRLLGRGDPDHDDCVQNAFVELVRSVDGYRGECSLEHWVAQIAARVVYRQIRQRKLYRRHFDTPAETPDRAEPVDASRRLVARDLFARIRAMLGAIETDNTYTFMLHDARTILRSAASWRNGHDRSAACKNRCQGPGRGAAGLAAPQ